MQRCCTPSDLMLTAISGIANSHHVDNLPPLFCTRCYLFAVKGQECCKFEVATSLEQASLRHIADKSACCMHWIYLQYFLATAICAAMTRSHHSDTSDEQWMYNSRDGSLAAQLATLLSLAVWCMSHEVHPQIWTVNTRRRRAWC